MQALTLFLSALACADGLLVGSSISGLSGAPLRAHAVTMATEQASALSSSATSIAAERYVATNRFRVKEGREAAFEKRWADRQSRLGLLDGFRFFCMMRRVEGKVSCTPQHATHRDAGPIFFTYLLTYSPTHLLTYVPTYLLAHSLASSTPHTAIFFRLLPCSLTYSLTWYRSRPRTTSTTSRARCGTTSPASTHGRRAMPSRRRTAAAPSAGSHRCWSRRRGTPRASPRPPCGRACSRCPAAPRPRPRPGAGGRWRRTGAQRSRGRPSSR